MKTCSILSYTFLIWVTEFWTIWSFDEIIKLPYRISIFKITILMIYKVTELIYFTLINYCIYYTQCTYTFMYFFSTLHVYVFSLVYNVCIV